MTQTVILIMGAVETAEKHFRELTACQTLF